MFCFSNWFAYNHYPLQPPKYLNRISKKKKFNRKFVTMGDEWTAAIVKDKMYQILSNFTCINTTTRWSGNKCRHFVVSFTLTFYFIFMDFRWKQNLFALFGLKVWNAVAMALRIENARMFSIDIININESEEFHISLNWGWRNRANEFHLPNMYNNNMKKPQNGATNRPRFTNFLK